MYRWEDQTKMHQKSRTLSLSMSFKKCAESNTFSLFSYFIFENMFYGCVSVSSVEREKLWKTPAITFHGVTN